MGVLNEKRCKKDGEAYWFVDDTVYINALSFKH
jgi:hypothetical protein